MDWVPWIFGLGDVGWLGWASEYPVSLVLWLLCFVGHLGIWCVVFNRVHATALPRKFRKQSEKVIVPIVVLPFCYMVVGMCLWFDTTFDSNYIVFKIYMFLTVVSSFYFVGRWVNRRFIIGLPADVVSSERVWLDIRERVHEDVSGAFFEGSVPQLLGGVPFNEASKLTLQKVTLAFDIPDQLEGFKICQLSDLHLTGQICIEYFQEIVKEANRFEPDMVVVTGDLVDEAICLPWLESTIGKLKAKYGVFYVLGNHDKRISDEEMLRGKIEACGLVAVSGAWHEVDVDGVKIAITGNELPWYRAADQLPPPDQQPESDFAILLSHSPDQFEWARDYKFDLMFAGHTHGGQIAFPLIGPIVAPSKFGVRYASGTFQIGSMLMHVSRGISGDEAIRVNSPPELGLITLTAKPEK